MKTFSAFQEQCLILSEAPADRIAAMTDDQFTQFMKGRTGPEAEQFRNLRSKARTTRVSSSTMRPRPGTGGVPSSGPRNPAPYRNLGVTKGAPAAAKGGLLKRLAGPAGAALDVGLETMDQKSRGRSTPAALAMGATKAGGGLAGAKAGAASGAAIGGAIGSAFGGVGAAPGAAIGGLVGGVGGYVAGSELAGRAGEMVAGATGKEKAAMAQANRQRQSGAALKGIGGKTTFDTKKGTMTTGAGSQQRTVKLGKTSVVTGPGGKQDVGHLAYKGGKAVYKRAADPSTLARTSSNPFERIGRTLFAGAYKKHDAAKKQQALNTARQSDVKRQKALGVKFKPGG